MTQTTRKSKRRAQAKRPKRPKQAKCKFCHSPFARRREWQDFCKSECRRDFHAAGGGAAAVVSRRAVRAVIDALATPGKLRDELAAALRGVFAP